MSEAKEYIDADIKRDAGKVDKLAVFREQVGITDVLELGSRPTKRKRPNIGIYNRVAVEERGTFSPIIRI